jgi:tetratricopeptide (TPR) repeat protein
MIQPPARLCSLAVLVTSLFAGLASAQTDRLYPNTGEAVIGKIKSIDKDKIVMTAGGKEQEFLASDVRRLLLQDEPQELERGRELIMDSQYDQAFEELKKLNIDAISRDVVKADASYYLALSQGEMALSGQGDLNNATKDVFGFVTKHGDSWHFYSAIRLLGSLAKAIGNNEKAVTFYQALAKAPSRELKIESVYQIGMLKRLQKDLNGAKADLGKVAALTPGTPGEKRLQTLAKAGLAVITAEQGQGDQAVKMVNELIATLNPTDTQTAATIYNALGASYAATGKDEDALIAYMHTQLMYSMHASEHVEALKELIELWTKVGKPDRAAQFRGELQQRYPGLSG